MSTKLRFQNHNSLSALELDRSSTSGNLKSFFPTASKTPHIIVGFKFLSFALLARVFFLVAAWFGVSILSLFLLLHCKDARKRIIEERTDMLRKRKKPTFVQRTTLEALGNRAPSLHAADCLPRLSVPHEDILPTSVSGPVKPHGGLVSNSSLSRSVSASAILPPQSLVHVKPVDAPLRRADATVVASSPNPLLLGNVMSGSTNSRLVRHVNPVSRNSAPTNAPLLLTGSSSLSDLGSLSQVVLLSAPVDDQRGNTPVIEEPVTPPQAVGFASQEYTDDLTVVYLEDGPVFIERRGLLLDYAEPQHPPSASHDENERFRQELLSDLGLTGFLPPQSGESGHEIWNRRRHHTTTEIPDSTSSKGKMRAQSCAGKPTVQAQDTDGATSSTAPKAATNRKEKIVSKRTSFDMTESNSVEIEHRFRNLVNKQTRTSLARLGKQL